MSKKFYLTLYLSSLVFALAALLAPVAGLFLTQNLNNAKREPIFLNLVSLAAAGVFQFLLTTLFLNLFLIYKMWNSINDGQASTTPGKAVGFLFIPLFNIYWIFRVWNGFPSNYNAYLERYGLSVPRISENLFTAYPILILLSAPPFFGILAMFAGVFVFLLLIGKTCDAVKLLNNAVNERHDSLAQMPLPIRQTATI